MRSRVTLVLSTYFVYLPVLLICFFVISGCSSTVKSESPGRVIERAIVWPDKPEKPRIAFIRSLFRAKDLGITSNIFSRIIHYMSGKKEKTLVKPMAVVATPDETLYVADPGVGGIHRFSIADNEHKILMQKDDVPLSTPVALALGPGNKIFISDSTLGIFVLEPGNDYVTKIKTNLDPRQATGITYNFRRQQLYVVDTLEHEVKIYNEKYKLVQGIGLRGTGEGEFNYPTMIWSDKAGSIYVSDSLNFRVQIFSPNGEYIRQFGELGSVTGSQSRPKGIATDKYGHIYIVDSLFHSVQVFNQRGDFLLNFGTQGAGNGEFWLPSGIFVGGKTGTKIYVADPYNKRVQVFSYIGDES